MSKNKKFIIKVVALSLILGLFAPLPVRVAYGSENYIIYEPFDYTPYGTLLHNTSQWTTTSPDNKNIFQITDGIDNGETMEACVSGLICAQHFSDDSEPARSSSRDLTELIDDKIIMGDGEQHTISIYKNLFLEQKQGTDDILAGRFGWTDGSDNLRYNNRIDYSMTDNEFKGILGHQLEGGTIWHEDKLILPNIENIPAHLMAYSGWFRIDIEIIPFQEAKVIKLRTKYREVNGNLIGSIPNDGDWWTVNLHPDNTIEHMNNFATIKKTNSLIYPDAEGGIDELYIYQGETHPTQLKWQPPNLDYEDEELFGLTDGKVDAIYQAYREQTAPESDIWNLGFVATGRNFALLPFTRLYYEIYDIGGDEVYTSGYEQIGSDTFFSKLFEFEDIPSGEYSFEVILYDHINDNWGAGKKIYLPVLIDGVQEKTKQAYLDEVEARRDLYGDFDDINMLDEVASTIINSLPSIIRIPIQYAMNWSSGIMEIVIDNIRTSFPFNWMVGIQRAFTEAVDEAITEPTYPSLIIKVDAYNTEFDLLPIEGIMNNEKFGEQDMAGKVDLLRDILVYITLISFGFLMIIKTRKLITELATLES